MLPIHSFRHRNRRLDPNTPSWQLCSLTRTRQFVLIAPCILLTTRDIDIVPPWRLRRRATDRILQTIEATIRSLGY